MSIVTKRGVEIIRKLISTDEVVVYEVFRSKKGHSYFIFGT